MLPEPGAVVGVRLCLAGGRSAAQAVGGELAETDEA